MMFGTVTLPVSVSEMVTTTFEFIGLFSEYLLLGLALILTPVIIGFIYGVVKWARRGKGATA